VDENSGFLLIDGHSWVCSSRPIYVWLNMILHGVFPIPVTENYLPRLFSVTELNFVDECGKDCHKNEGNLTSNNNHVLEHESMKSLKEFVMFHVNEFIDEIIKPEHKIEPYLTQSWFNYTKTGERHHRHAHPNSFLSGVLYINAGREDKINFHREWNGFILDIPTREGSDYNTGSMWLGARTGKLLIFPSKLTHDVSVTESKETRISLSFNTFLKGTIGQEKNLTGLTLY
jgi:uncharacterized protein (TIGR02466 family)